jgi:hypothetical protein
MQRTITTKHIIIDFPLPRNPYIPHTSYPRAVAYINHRIAALSRAFPAAERVFFTPARIGPGDVIRVILPVRHTYRTPAWRVYRTAFHGGGLVSKHYTREAAERAARRWIGNTDCTCGCAGVVAPWERPRDAETNRNITHNPYALTD